VEITPLLTTPLSAFAATLVLHAAALRVFPRIGLLDFPERYGLARGRLPYPTGILVVTLFVCVFPLLQAIDRSVLGVLCAVALLGTVSAIDDRRPLSPFLRLAAQAGAAAIVFFSGDCTGGRICSVTNPLDGTVGGPFLELNGAFPILAFGATVLWLVVTTNALNWFDGVPGQTSMLSGIGFLTIGFLSLSGRVDQPDVALLAFVLAGLAFGATLFELPLPLPKVVPGDSGAMFFGLMLGVLTIYAGGKVATGFLVLGVPLVDSFLVVGRRILAGKNPARGSRGGEHLHHRLLARGWHPWGVISLTTGLGVAFGVTALFLSTFEKFVAGLLLAGIITALSVWSSPRRSSDTKPGAPTRNPEKGNSH
jgi:UDP-N-acetylmuramyl pentapeptide phosphotransferase/UDP-N-acetylglucosamine-1-phosphate transferase